MQISFKNWLKLIAINDMLLSIKQHELLRGTTVLRVTVIGVTVIRVSMAVSL